MRWPQTSARSGVLAHEASQMLFDGIPARSLGFERRRDSKDAKDTLGALTALTFHPIFLILNPQQRVDKPKRRARQTSREPELGTQLTSHPDAAPLIT